MTFQVSALPYEPFESLFTLDDPQLAALGATRCVATETPGFPCRVSLQDAAVGEPLVLIPYFHQPSDSPYKASGPIFIREQARQAAPAAGEVPELLRSRMLSVRAYDSKAVMVGAQLVQGRELESAIERLFDGSGAEYLHVHSALPGCYLCRIDRA